MKTNINKYIGPQTGMTIYYPVAAEPSGWLLCTGKTIGNVLSGATSRANKDTFDLFKLCWESMANTEAPVSGGRGSSAEDDFFIANKTIVIPDLRGRGFVGRDNMGGIPAGRITISGSGVDGTIQGKVEVSPAGQGVTLDASHLKEHNHNVTVIDQDWNHRHRVYNEKTGSTTYGTNWPGQDESTLVGYKDSKSAGPSHNHTIVPYNFGGGQQHNNLQPSIIMNVLVKL